MLVHWAIEMAAIGYGRTREQLCLTVKAMLDKDGRTNPFRQNMPGKDWWYAFLKRHPEISQRTPEVLQKLRAYCCTPAAIEKWFSDFESFVVLNDIKNQSRRIWNADESGFPLCPKTSRVIAMRSQKHVYSVSSDSKCQITTLVAANASGNVIPPMHIYPGKRAPRSNLLKGCVDGAYYGRSDKLGWMTTKLFYGWLANHFAKQIPPECPVLLLVDGHSTYIDVEVSKLCSQNGILLYCLPPHSSRVLQPLDVGFFGSLKRSWQKAVSEYQLKNIGAAVTKDTFASVFKDAWTSIVKMQTIIHSFEKAGICPLNKEKVFNGDRLGPSKLYKDSISPTSDISSAPTTTSKSDLSPEQPLLQRARPTTHTPQSLQAMEALMEPETVKKYERRFEEGYDVEDKDELYKVWLQFKNLHVYL